MINTETIKKIIDGARFVPTGDNCDPWRFVWSQDKLFVYHSREKTDNSYDNNFHTSLLSLGMLVEAIKIQALEEGWDSSFYFQMSHVIPISYDSYWAHVKFSKATKKNDILFPVLKNRYTDRNCFLSKNIPEDLIENIKKEGSKYNVNISILNHIPASLKKFMLKVEGYTWNHLQAFLDLSKWLRLTNKEVDNSNDGLPWPGLGCNILEIYSLRLLRKFTFLYPLFSLFGTSWLARAKLRKNLKKSTLVLFSSTDKSDETLIRTGQAAMRVWLQLNYRNYAVQPLTLQSLFSFDFHTRGITSKLRPSYQTVFQQGLYILRDSFHLKAGEFPIWMLRTGEPAPFPESGKTKRLDVDELLKIS